jgi:acetoin utilization protein AcuB
MIASELISSSLYPAKQSDPVYRIQDMLVSYRLLQLPVVDQEGRLIAIVDEDFLGTLDDEALIGEHVTNKGLLIHINPRDHIFDIIRLFGEQKKTMLPVLDDQGFCLGIISQEDVFLAIANSYSFREQGGILVCHVSYRTAEKIIRSPSHSR